MIDWMRRYLDTPRGKGVGIVVGILAVLFAAYQIKSMTADAAADLVNGVIYIDVETKQPFAHTIVAGETIPILAPSGKKTGYPAEICNWTKEGGVSTTDTPVLLNSALGKPGPTFCPVCGRLVSQHNERAFSGSKPPPTQEEYLKQHSGAGTSAFNSR